MRRVFCLLTMVLVGLGGALPCPGRGDVLKPVAVSAKPPPAPRPVDEVTRDLAETTRTDLASLAFPLDQPSPELEAATKQTLETLEGLHLSAPGAAGVGKPHLVLTADQRGVLAGDFAGDGSFYALVELPSGSYGVSAGAAFARFQAGRWQLRQLWKVQITWHPAGWQPNEEERSIKLLEGASERPFWTEHLAGDPAVWVVMAGDLGRFSQSEYVLRFDAGKRRLELLAVSFQGEPKFLPGGWLELFYTSGHKAIWEESQFLRWKNGKLKLGQIWYDEAPYNGVAPPFVDAEIFDAKGRLSQSYVATDAETGNDHATRVTVTRNGRGFGAATFVWPHPLNEMEQSVSNSEDVQRAFLFERLTGLARRFYPGSTSDNDKPAPRLENVARVQVQGSAEARRRLGVPPKKPRRTGLKPGGDG